MAKNSRIALQLSLAAVRVAETQGVTTLMTALYDIPTSFGSAATQAPACSLMLGSAATARVAGVKTGSNHTVLALKRAP